MDFAPELESFGFCPFAQLSGKPCPFCGGSRAVVALGSGRITDALHLNAYVVTLIALLILIAAVDFLRVRQIRPTANHFREVFKQVSIGRGIPFRAFWAALAFGWLWNFFRW